MLKLPSIVAAASVLALAACASVPQAPIASAAPAADEAPSEHSQSTLAAAIPSTSESAPAPAQPEPAALPATCAGDAKDFCSPDAEFAKRLCAGGAYPEVALALLSKGTPWTRVYMRGDVDAWNASGGRTHRTKLAFDEEVLVLQKRAAPSMGGIVMTGVSATYDVLRWDGSCVSVMSGEVTSARPPQPKPAAVPWQRLDDRTKGALLASPKINSTHAKVGKECAGASSDAAKCAKAATGFNTAIAEYVRNVGALPAPARLP